MLLVSCSQNNNAYPSVSSTKVSDKETSFMEMFPIKEMNTKIKFWPPQEVFKLSECINLALENSSTEKIVFPPDYGLKIFTYGNNRWKDIENTAQYYPPGNTQISPKGPDSPGVIDIPLCPDLTNSKLPIEIRVVLVGESQPTNEAENTQVSAYIDIVIQD
jgi:hypothetical protein